MSKPARLTVILAIASIAFVLGCVTEALVIPPVRAGTNPTRWEYTCQPGYSLRGAVEMSNRVGAQGWELVTQAGEMMCFKRPLP
jgi:hypothetical protein